MAGNGEAIIALDQKRMEATVKQDFAGLASIIADVGGPDQGTETKGLRIPRPPEAPLLGEAKASGRGRQRLSSCGL
jgi:hypothetical protein